MTTQQDCNESMMRANAEREVHWGGNNGRTEEEMEREVHDVMNRMRMEQANS